MKLYKNLMTAVGFAAALGYSSYGGAAEQGALPVGQQNQGSVSLATIESASKDLIYPYISKTYGYRILCPKPPVGIIPAQSLFENRTGEILIFENEEYHITYAWVVLVDAFPNDVLPDLNAIDPEEATKLLGRIMDSNGYEGIMLLNLTEHNKAIFAMTAKEVDIDEDGDGVVDATAHADGQMAVMFFRGAQGERYGFELINNPEIRPEALNAFIAGACTLQSAQQDHPIP